MDPRHPLKSEDDSNLLGAAQNHNYFNDMLSPFFAPYGIDVSHFPLTNPPIFESAMMMNNQGQPRRRISISNGQIGQITNHTGEDWNVDPRAGPVVLPAGPQQAEQAQEMSQLMPQIQGMSVGVPMATAQQLNGVATDQPLVPPSAAPAPRQRQQHQQQQQRQQQQQHISTNANGIPTSKLMYNNEVIFNPEAGPIPGTAAWKKARLLERNRLAASKCRERKKAAQNQLKENVEKYAKELDELASENDALQDQLAQVRRVAKEHGLTEILQLLQ